MKILQRKIKEFEENLSNPPDADTSAIEASIVSWKQYDAVCINFDHVDSCEWKDEWAKVC